MVLLAISTQVQALIPDLTSFDWDVKMNLFGADIGGETGDFAGSTLDITDASVNTLGGVSVIGTLDIHHDGMHISNAPVTGMFNTDSTMHLLLQPTIDSFFYLTGVFNTAFEDVFAFGAIEKLGPGGGAGFWSAVEQPAVIPVPSAIFLLGGAVLGMGLIGRKRA